MHGQAMPAVRALDTILALGVSGFRVEKTVDDINPKDYHIIRNRP